MPIRTLEHLEAHLTEDLKWRLTELENWKSMMDSCRQHQKTGALRAGVTLLYAHWEGYVKEAARSYLEYVGRKGLTLAELRAELAAVALRGMLGRGEQSKKSTDHTEIVIILREEATRKAVLPYDSAAIKTNSNLAFEVFEDIMHSLGCDASRHDLQRTLINARLLKNRNAIAHGRELPIALEDWVVMRNRVEVMLHDVRDQFRNAAALELFRRQNILTLPSA